MSSKLNNTLMLLRPTCLVCQQINQPTQFFWDGAGSHHSAWDVFILHDHPAIGRLAHVQVNTQATRDKLIKENKNKHLCDVLSFK